MQARKNNAVTLGEGGLDLGFPDGSSGYFNYFWLRDNCPTSFDPVTRERSYDLFAEPEAPVAAEACLDGEELEVLWCSGHRSRYPLDVLASYRSGKPRADVAHLPRRAWYAGHYKDMPRFTLAELKTDPAKRKDWIEAILVEGVALVTGLPDTPEALEETASLAGHVRPSFFGKVFEVYTHINPTNTAYTAAALELHTDLPSEDFAPGVQYLHCRANSVEGGNSIFVDAVAVAEDFRRAHPEDFALLAETEVPFYCEHDSFDMRARQRVIELDRDGEVEGVTISQHIADVFDLPQSFLDRYYPAFFRFGQALRDPKYVMRFRLNAGECICFDNHRVVHGREAYTASSGERHLRGCYTDRGELRSAYRVLSGGSRFSG
ncbi:TauD/TfdA family dioxygenase [Nisaea sediminum]|uniref:TauD/TfdA family dioxygenase n=1 Tax=Nisaea sediminum TaxID=2775867 RepID=UPI0018660C5B|nr:TauD/TfdA family dioxygenase [Nisaea sediminum]